jgi:hypothetical protein
MKIRSEQSLFAMAFIFVSIGLLGVSGVLADQVTSGLLQHPAAQFEKVEKRKSLVEDKNKKIQNTLRKAKRDIEKLY